MADIDQLLKPLMLGDLRAQLRARGVNPAGGQAELKERLKDHMLATGNFSLGGSAPPPIAGGSTMRFCSLVSLQKYPCRPTRLKSPYVSA